MVDARHDAGSRRNGLLLILLYMETYDGRVLGAEDRRAGVVYVRCMKRRLMLVWVGLLQRLIILQSIYLEMQKIMFVIVILHITLKTPTDVHCFSPSSSYYVLNPKARKCNTTDAVI